MSCFFKELNRQINDSADTANHKIVHVLDNCKVAYNKHFFDVCQEEKILIQFQSPYSADFLNRRYIGIESSGAGYNSTTI